ncbi:MAG TPA: GlsB/YeaQ/YmgE family stress response membrane protein [Polyangiaceae bacterium]|nr:GlsB/YeaQ/YmgE family stress response membrane protein [Polyangiaceae bacterium]
MLVAGKAGGWIVSLMSGVTGSALGGLFGGADTFRSDPETAAFSMSLLGAFALTAVYHVVAARRRGSA